MFWFWLRMIVKCFSAQFPELSCREDDQLMCLPRILQPLKCVLSHCPVYPTVLHSFNLITPCSDVSAAPSCSLHQRSFHIWRHEIQTDFPWMYAAIFLWHDLLVKFLYFPWCPRKSCKICWLSPSGKRLFLRNIQLTHRNTQWNNYQVRCASVWSSHQETSIRRSTSLRFRCG